jgi:hypothetical protein
MAVGNVPCQISLGVRILIGTALAYLQMPAQFIPLAKTHTASPAAVVTRCALVKYLDLDHTRKSPTNCDLPFIHNTVSENLFTPNSINEGASCDQHALILWRQYNHLLYRSASSSCLEPPRLIREHEDAFWTAGRREIPLFAGNPWDFYEQLLKLGSQTWMVLCNDRSAVRVIEGFDNVDESPNQYPHVDQGSPSFPILRIRYPNFVDIDEIYLCQGDVFAITSINVISYKA